MLNWLESMQMKKDKKRWMELQMAMLPLVTDLGLIMGEGWKSLEGSTELCFQLPIHLPQLLSLQMQDNVRGRPIQTPLSLKIAILDLVMWNKGLQDTIPHDKEVCQGDNISSSGNILKTGRESMRKAGNHKSQT